MLYKQIAVPSIRTDLCNKQVAVQNLRTGVHKKQIAVQNLRTGILKKQVVVQNLRTGVRKKQVAVKNLRIAVQNFQIGIRQSNNNALFSNLPVTCLKKSFWVFYGLSSNIISYFTPKPKRIAKQIHPNHLR